MPGLLSFTAAAKGLVYNNVPNVIVCVAIFGYLSWVAHSNKSGALAVACVALFGAGGSLAQLGINNIVQPLTTRWANGMRYYIEGETRDSNIFKIYALITLSPRQVNTVHEPFNSLLPQTLDIACCRRRRPSHQRS